MKLEVLTEDIDGTFYTIYIHRSLDYFSVREGEKDEEILNGYELTVQNVYSGYTESGIIDLWENGSDSDLLHYIVSNWFY